MKYLSHVAVLSSVASLFGAGCGRELVGAPPPLMRPHFPTGLALHPDGGALAVVSSNFDLAYNRGAVLLADLTLVDEAIATAGGALVRLDDGNSPYVDAGQCPSFGDAPLFLGGGRLLLPSREQNQVVDLPMRDDGSIAFACDPAPEGGDGQVCGLGARALQVPGNDPFRVVALSEANGVTRLVLGLLTTPDVLYLEVAGGASLDGTLSLTPGLSFSLTGYSSLGEPIGTRGLALRSAQPGAPETMFLLVQRQSTGLTTNAIDLVWFDASSGGGASLSTLPLTGRTGAVDGRSLVLSQDQSALFAALRAPDAIARLDLDVSDGRVVANLGPVTSTCYQPVTLATATVVDVAGVQHERLYVTCFDNDTIVAYDARSLVETAVVRGLGRGPYGLALDAAHEPPRAYVSFFEDDTVAVIDLLDDTGAEGMHPRALIGIPRDERSAP